MAERYQSVNGAWPEKLPTITDQEALDLVRRLHRKFMGRKIHVPVRIATGNRLTWHRGDRFDVNPRREKNGTIQSGWQDIVHLLSHYVHGKKWPSHKSHDGRGTHAFIEKSMIEHVVNSGWLDGKLKRKPKPRAPKLSPQEARKARIVANLKRWEAKRRRAERAIKKLRKQVRYYERLDKGLADNQAKQA